MVVSQLEFSKISLKFHKSYCQGYIWSGIFQNFKFQISIHLRRDISEISLKSLQKFQLQNTTLQVEIRYYCGCMSVFKGRKFEIIVNIVYFNIFHLKPIIKPDNIHNFTKFLGFPHNSGGSLLKQISN